MAAIPLPLSKPVTLITRMAVSPHVLSVLDGMAAKHGLSRDDYLTTAIMLWVSQERSLSEQGGPKQIGEITREVTTALELRQRVHDVNEGFGGWGS